MCITMWSHSLHAKSPLCVFAHAPGSVKQNIGIDRFAKQLR